MSWTLSRAIAHVEARRVRSAAASAPLLAACLGLAGLAAPVVAYRAARELAGALGPVLGDLDVARALVAGLTLPASAAGAALALAFRGLDALDRQVATAPVERRRATLAVAAPRLTATTVLLVSLAAGPALVLGAASPGGVPAAAVLLGAPAALAATGALIAETMLHAVRGRWWPLVTGVAAGVASVALVELMARAISGSSTAALVAVTVAPVAAVAAAGGVVGLAASRPPARVRAARAAVLPVPSGSLAAAACLAAAVLARRTDIRLALVAGATFGTGGVVLGRVAGLGDAAALVLGGASAALAASLAPLAAGGLIEEARWAWRAGGALLVAVGWSAASLALVLLALAPTVLVGTLSGDVSAAAALQPAATAMLAWTAGLIAGALVPRLSAGAADDAASLVVLAAVAGALAVAIGTLEPRVASVGVPGAVSGVVALAVAAATAVGTLAARAGRR